MADLRWLLLSPPLLRDDAEYPCSHVGFTAGERAAIEAWLAAVAARPEALMAHLQAARPAKEVPVRLGRYAERLLMFYLQHGPLHRLVAANVAIVAPPAERPDGGRDHTTKGEIDFLVEAANGERLHWELAVKYFVARDQPVLAIDDYMGPDSSESFRRKVEKLVKHQAAQRPPPPYDSVAWRPQIFSRGQMFYPLRRYVGLDEGVTPCRVLAPDHRRGFWLPIAQIGALAAPEVAARLVGAAPTRFAILERAQWMASRRHGDPLRVLDDVAALRAAVLAKWADAAMRRAHAPRAGIKIAALDAVGDELARGFIMPDELAHRCEDVTNDAR